MIVPLPGAWDEKPGSVGDHVWGVEQGCVGEPSSESDRANGDSRVLYTYVWEAGTGLPLTSSVVSNDSTGYPALLWGGSCHPGREGQRA